MQMRFQHIDPHPLLRGYIEKMWVFESSGRMPVDDLKLVVPNGNIKLTVAFRNGNAATANSGGERQPAKALLCKGLLHRRAQVCTELAAELD